MLKEALQQLKNAQVASNFITSAPKSNRQIFWPYLDTAAEQRMT